MIDFVGFQIPGLVEEDRAEGVPPAKKVKLEPRPDDVQKDESQEESATASKTLDPKTIVAQITEQEALSTSPVPNQQGNMKPGSTSQLKRKAEETSALVSDSTTASKSAKAATFRDSASSSIPTAVLEERAQTTQPADPISCPSKPTATPTFQTYQQFAFLTVAQQGQPIPALDGKLLPLADCKGLLGIYATIADHARCTFPHGQPHASTFDLRVWTHSKDSKASRSLPETGLPITTDQQLMARWKALNLVVNMSGFKDIPFIKLNFLQLGLLDLSAAQSKDVKFIRFHSKIQRKLASRRPDSMTIHPTFIENSMRQMAQLEDCVDAEMSRLNDEQAETRQERDRYKQEVLAIKQNPGGLADQAIEVQLKAKEEELDGLQKFVPFLRGRITELGAEMSRLKVDKEDEIRQLKEKHELDKEEWRVKNEVITKQLRKMTEAEAKRVEEEKRVRMDVMKKKAQESLAKRKVT